LCRSVCIMLEGTEVDQKRRSLDEQEEWNWQSRKTDDVWLRILPRLNFEIRLLTNLTNLRNLTSWPWNRSIKMCKLVSRSLPIVFSAEDRWKRCEIEPTLMTIAREWIVRGKEDAQRKGLGRFRRETTAKPQNPHRLVADLASTPTLCRATWQTGPTWRIALHSIDPSGTGSLSRWGSNHPWSGSGTKDWWKRGAEATYHGNRHTKEQLLGSRSNWHQ
jgi:hypothetical protein